MPRSSDVTVKIKGVRDVLTDLQKQGITSPGEVASCTRDKLVNLNREEHDKCLSRKHGGNCGGGSRSGSDKDRVPALFAIEEKNVMVPDVRCFGSSSVVRSSGRQRSRARSPRLHFWMASGAVDERELGLEGPGG